MRNILRFYLASNILLAHSRDLRSSPVVAPDGVHRPRLAHKPLLLLVLGTPGLDQLLVRNLRAQSVSAAFCELESLNTTYTDLDP